MHVQPIDFAQRICTPVALLDTLRNWRKSAPDRAELRILMVCMPTAYGVG